MKAAIKAIAGGLGFEIRRLSPAAPSLGYLDAAVTIAEAREAGLSVNALLARRWGTEGLVDLAIDKFAALGVFDQPKARVVEIGPGTGSHMERILARYQPSAYEIYETSEGWRNHLAQTSPLVSAWPASGFSMPQTADASADAVLCLGTFVYLPFLVAVRYWKECCRITKPGGYVAFDILSEAAFTDDLIEHWLGTGINYPIFHSRAFVEQFFAARGLEPVGAFQRRYADAKSECLVFRKT